MADDPLAAAQRRVFGTLVVMALIVIGVIAFAVRSCSSGRRIQALAILPFKPLPPAQRQEALEVGMADTLIAKIARVRAVVVRPLSAVRRFTRLDRDAVEIGRQLGADAVLDGSIGSRGRNIRVTVRLLRVSDSTQIWAGEYDTSFAGIFSVQDAIAANLADALSLKLTADERRQMQRRETSNPEAYRAYLLGRSRMGTDFQKALSAFQEAVALDPAYARAYVALAETAISRSLGSDDPAAAWAEQARFAASKAVALDPTGSDGWTALGSAKFWYEWDWVGAERALRRAVTLEPTDPAARRRLAQMLSGTGRFADAQREIGQAVKLDPLSLINSALMGQFALQAGEVDAAIGQEKRTLQIDPRFWISRLFLGNAYERAGMYEAALQAYAQSWRDSAGATTEPLARYGCLLALRGRLPEARAVLDRLNALARQRYVPPYNLAMLYAALRDDELAIETLRRACRERDVRMTSLKVEPLWNDLRKNPRFAEIDRCVSLP